MRSLTRRAVLARLGTALAAVPVAAACVTSRGDDAGTRDDDGGATGDAGSRVDAGARGDDAGTAAIDPTLWASGGVAAMADPASYGDPFADDDAACATYCAMTLGPCFGPSAPTRRDVSEAQPGVPMLLALRVVDVADGCAPVADAEIEIWHAHRDGMYSGDDLPSVSFCTGNDADAQAAYWFRGVQRTDDAGRATFQTCFPGWYPGRAMHVHFVVRRGAAQSAVSQLFFPDDVTTGVCANVPGYAERGQPDTDNAQDGIAGDEVARFSVDVQQASDGVMIARKTIGIGGAGC